MRQGAGTASGQSGPDTGPSACRSVRPVRRAPKPSVGSRAHDEHTSVHYGHGKKLRSGAYRQVRALITNAPPGTRTPNPRIKSRSPVPGGPFRAENRSRSLADVVALWS